MSSSSEESKATIAKSVAMCVLFGASMTLGTLPMTLTRLFKWNSSAKNSIYVQVLLCFGGGVLLCTTFLHLLPEVCEKINELEYVPKYEIHYAELLMCTGFFTMYLVEECIHYYLHYKHKNRNEKVLERSLSIRRGDTLEKEKETTNNIIGTEDLPAIIIPETPITVCQSTHKENHHHHHSHFAGNDVDDAPLKAIRGLLVVLALSVHELFEGLAVGLESSSKNVWYMFGAVSAHKLVIAFCIGIELVTSGMNSCLIVVYIFTFAVVSPLGIGIGILVTQSGGNSSDLPSVILQGLASGTLLYVVFFEILRTERKSGLRQFCAVFLGFFIMLMLTLVE